MVEWLPEGWTVQVKVRRSGRKDSLYIDPTSGYAHRSINAVIRYLTTGVRSKRVMKPKAIPRKDGKIRKATSGTDQNVGRKDPTSVVVFVPAHDPRQPKQFQGKTLPNRGIVPHDLNNVTDARLTQQASQQILQMKPNPTSQVEPRDGQVCNIVAATQFSWHGTTAIGGLAPSRLPQGASLVHCRQNEDETDKVPMPCSFGSTAIPVKMFNSSYNPFAISANQEKGPFAGFGVTPGDNATKEGLEDSATKEGLENNTANRESLQANEVIPGDDVTKRMTAEKPESSSTRLPIEESWTDPCIDFAVTTLTGAVPAQKDVDIGHMFQQHLGSFTPCGSVMPDCQIQVKEAHPKEKEEHE